MDIAITIEHPNAVPDVDVYNWCLEHCKGEWRYIRAVTTHSLDTLRVSKTELFFTFEDEDDLMLVRLVWGGELVEKR